MNKVRVYAKGIESESNEVSRIAKIVKIDVIFSAKSEGALGIRDQRS